MSAEIPGQVSQREIAEANEMVIAERDSLLTEKRRLEQQLAAALERERLLVMDSECLRIASEKLGCDKSDVVRTIENNQDREKVAMDCVKLYANEKNWGRYVMWLLNYNGFTPAQECVKKVEAMK